jgi:hypothetical protein
VTDASKAGRGYDQRCRSAAEYVRWALPARLPHPAVAQQILQPGEPSGVCFVGAAIPCCRESRPTGNAKYAGVE